MLNKITPVIITYNEEPNIGRALEKLVWAQEIIVVDSFSNDGTISALKLFPQVKVFQRKFDTFAAQCNYALSQAGSEWILCLDADYILSGELVEEIGGLSGTDTNAYFARFKYFVSGKPLRAALLPPRAILFRKDKASYIQDGHAHRLMVNGNTGQLKGYIYHDDRKSFSRWMSSQGKYAKDEARKLNSVPWARLSLPDRIRKFIIFAPFIVPVYCLFVKGLLFDGCIGIIYSFQRMIAECWLSARLIESCLSGNRLDE